MLEGNVVVAALVSASPGKNVVSLPVCSAYQI